MQDGEDNADAVSRGVGSVSDKGGDLARRYADRPMVCRYGKSRCQFFGKEVRISNSRNVTVQDVRLVNSPFWTNHLYRCDHVRYINCYIYAPTENVYQAEPQRGAPSSDAIDLDVCHDILIYGCYMHVSDDAVVLKGGKGTWADKNPDNGHNANIGTVA